VEAPELVGLPRIAYIGVLAKDPSDELNYNVRVRRLGGDICNGSRRLVGSYTLYFPMHRNIPGTAHYFSKISRRSAGAWLYAHHPRRALAAFYVTL